MKNTFYLLPIICLLFSASALEAQKWVETGNPIVGIAAGDKCGNSIDINDDGTVLAIGSWENDDNGNNAGNVRIFKLENESWIQIGNALYGEEEEKKGFAVSLNAAGDIVALSTPYYNGNTGKISIYRNSGGEWTQMGNDIIGEYGKYVASGVSIDLNAMGDLIAISNHGAGITNQGAGIIALYKYDNNNWTRIAEIEGGAWNEQLGGAGLMFNGDATVLAARPSSGTYYPYIRVFRKSNEGVWEQVGDSIPEARSSFSLNRNGTTVASGNRGYYAGWVTVYTNVNDTWIQKGDSIALPMPAVGYSLSTQLSSDGNMLVVGQPGAGKGQVLTYQYIDEKWLKLEQELWGENNGDNFGSKISISNNDSVIAVSAPSNDYNGENAGQVKVYKLAKTFTVTFKDFDDSVLKTETVIQDSSAIPPDPPSREGYTFTGWDIEYTSVISDLIVTAQYVETTYAVTFMVVHGTETLAGATVHFNGTNYTTDNDGQVVIDNLSPGDYNYVVDLNDYQEFTGEFSIVDSNISENVVLIAVGINDVHSYECSVYPNPSTGILNIEVRNSSSNEIHVSVYNMNLSLIYSKSHLYNKIVKVDLSKLPKGHYITKIETGKEIIYRKIALN